MAFNASNIANMPSESRVTPTPGIPMSSVDDSSLHASVQFPVPWTSRTQTPIKRVPSGTMWGQPDSWRPQTYGGPQG